MPDLTIMQECALECLRNQPKHDVRYICQVIEPAFEVFNSLLVFCLVTRRSLGNGMWEFRMVS